MAGKKSSAPNKSEFVRSLPDAMPTDEVIAKGKALGLELTRPYINSIRSLARKAQGKTPRKGGRRPGRPAGSGAPSRPSGGDIERSLVALVVDHGIRNVEAALEKIRERLHRSFA